MVMSDGDRTEGPRKEVRAGIMDCSETKRGAGPALVAPSS